MPAVNMALAGEFTLYLLIALAFLKVFATAFCRSFGFHGGILLPACFLELCWAVHLILLWEMEDISMQSGGAAACTVQPLEHQ